MPSPANLIDAFTKGELKKVDFANNTQESPSTYKKWLIVGGTINHITATATHLRQVKKEANTILTGLQIRIAAGSASSRRNLFEANPTAWGADDSSPAFSFYILDDTQSLILTGAATVSASVWVLEW